MPSAVILNLTETLSQSLIIGGVGGPKIHRNGSALEAETATNTPAIVRGAPGVGPNDFATVSQLGGSSGSVVTSVAFTFASGSMVLGAIAAGTIMTRAQILISVSFDGSNPSVRFGTSGNLSEFLAASDSSPTTADQYLSLDLIIQPTPDILFLTVTAPGATQGAGVLLYELFTP